MDTPTPNPPRKRSRFTLEDEVIMAVIGLYLFIAGVLLAIHHLQPSGQPTMTSSPSPSHADKYGVPGGAPHLPATEPAPPAGKP